MDENEITVDDLETLIAAKERVDDLRGLNTSPMYQHKIICEAAAELSPIVEIIKNKIIAREVLRKQRSETPAQGYPPAGWQSFK